MSEPTGQRWTVGELARRSGVNGLSLGESKEALAACSDGLLAAARRHLDRDQPPFSRLD